MDNIGGFVTAAFDNPKKFIGQSIAIAGDELTMLQVVQKLSKVIECDVKYVEMPMAQMKNSNPGWATMFQWFNDYGFDYDIEKPRRELPDLMDFEMWLHKFGWEQFVREEIAAGRAAR